MFKKWWFLWPSLWNGSVLFVSIQITYCNIIKVFKIWYELLVEKIGLLVCFFHPFYINICSWRHKSYINICSRRHIQLLPSAMTIEVVLNSLFMSLDIDHTVRTLSASSYKNQYLTPYIIYHIPSRHVSRLAMSIFDLNPNP